METAPSLLHQPGPVSFGDALKFWAKIGFVSFGGPAGQIALLHQELVERRRWISEKRFLHALNYCMLLPGPEAQQLATYVGWLLHGTRGGITAGVLFVLPSLLILIALSWLYIAFQDVPAVAGVLYGVKPAVTAIVLFAAYRIGSRTLKNPTLKLIAAVSFVAILALKVPFPLIVLLAAVTGYIGSRVKPEHFALGGHTDAHNSYGPALINDDTPLPRHAQFRKSRFIGYCVVGFWLWLTPIAALVALFGWEGVLTQMAWFFTKAALLTFGGAYAVLPYVFQGAVEHHGWLTAAQMMDGLALGETTPGPLIMVVAFVGFIGGWTQQLFGADELFLAGTAAACVVTFFTFLPSFLFILLGAPLVEATHGTIGFTAPLTAITAAVVGVVLNLALFFGYHTFWPAGFDGNLDLFSVLVAVAATVALIRYKAGVIPLIAACAAVGLIYSAVT